MGRSVSYPCGAEVAFMDLSADADWCHNCCNTAEECDCEEDDADIQAGEIDFDYYREWAEETAARMFPSMWEVGREWRGREDRVLLRNSLVDFGWSEYYGLAAFWLVPREGLDGNLEAFAERWIASVSPKFQRTFGTLRKIGTFSNGEALFERVAA